MPVYNCCYHLGWLGWRLFELPWVSSSLELGMTLGNTSHPHLVEQCWTNLWHANVQDHMTLLAAASKWIHELRDEGGEARILWMIRVLLPSAYPDMCVKNWYLIVIENIINLPHEVVLLHWWQLQGFWWWHPVVMYNSVYSMFSWKFLQPIDRSITHNIAVILKYIRSSLPYISYPDLI